MNSLIGNSAEITEDFVFGDARMRIVSSFFVIPNILYDTGSSLGISGGACNRLISAYVCVFMPIIGDIIRNARGLRFRKTMIHRSD